MSGTTVGQASCCMTLESFGFKRSVGEETGMMMVLQTETTEESAAVGPVTKKRRYNPGWAGPAMVTL